MTVYSCAKCQFIFSRAGAVDTCPDCGHSYILVADEKDTAAYLKKRDESVQRETEKRAPADE